MIYKCVNCGGNVVYDPKSRGMRCLSCGGAECQEAIASDTPRICMNCGAEIPFSQYGSASRCPSCGTYIIRDDMVRYPYGADLVMPFTISKEQAEKKLRNEFGHKLFLPTTFLTTKTLEKLRGIYVPFWLYDYKTDVDYHAVGTKVRHWTRGDRRYTETSYFNVYRKLHINFDGIPVDASLAMDDKIMDLMEPYKYGGLIPNDNKYLSGFEAETYNYTPDQMEPRAIDKINNDTDEWIKKATSNYTTLTNVNKNVHHSRIANRFALLPVWEYEYRYNGQNYKFYVNGQTGKCVGTAPLSKEKAFGMSTIFGVALFACLEMLFLLLGVM